MAASSASLDRVNGTWDARGADQELGENLSPSGRVARPSQGRQEGGEPPTPLRRGRARPRPRLRSAPCSLNLVSFLPKCSTRQTWQLPPYNGIIARAGWTPSVFFFPFAFLKIKDEEYLSVGEVGNLSEGYLAAQRPFFLLLNWNDRREIILGLLGDSF